MYTKKQQRHDIESKRRKDRIHIDARECVRT